MIDCDLTWVAIPHKLVVALVFDGWNMSKSVKSTLCYCVWRAWFNLILPMLQVAMVKSLVMMMYCCRGHWHNQILYTT